MRLFKIALAAGLATMLIPAANSYAAFPDRPVTILVGFDPGGGTDLLARVIAKSLTSKWGQSVVVENRSGADGTIAEDVLAHAPPDGYMMMMTNNNLTVTPSERTLDIDPVKDFSPVVMVAAAPDVLVVNPNVTKVNSLKDLIDLAKSKPGQLNFGSTGIGGPPFLEMELLKKDAGVNIVHVPYTGTGPARVALLGGEIDVMFDSIQGSLGDIKAGKLRALAVSRGTRSPTLPDVPTVAEAAGIPGFDGGGSWYGIIAPAKVPPDLLKKLHDDMVGVLQSPDVAKTIADQGFNVVAGSSQDFGDFIASDAPKWASLLKSIGIKPSN